MPLSTLRREFIINTKNMRKRYIVTSISTGLCTLRAAQRKPAARQFIFVSTVLVHGRSNDRRAPFSENDFLTPRGLYGMSKAAAEAGLKTLAQAGEMRVTFIRPPLVDRAYAKGNFALLLKAVRRGIPLPFAAIQNHRAFPSVENLASFILQRLSRADKAASTGWRPPTTIDEGLPLALTASVVGAPA
jgi:UDP-glucose 4-epimerase